METNSPIYIDLDFTKTDSHKLQIDISQLATSKFVMESKETKYFDKNGEEIFSIEEVNNKEKTLYYLSIPKKLFFQELLTEKHLNHINHVISTNYNMDFNLYPHTMVYKKKTESKQNINTKKNKNEKIKKLVKKVEQLVEENTTITQVGEPNEIKIAIISDGKTEVVKGIGEMNKIKLSSALLDVKINKENSIYKNLIWTTKNGDKIPFIELKESHIDNIIRLFGDKEIEIEFKIQPIPLDEVFFKGFKDLPEEHQEIIAEN